MKNKLFKTLSIFSALALTVGNISYAEGSYTFVNEYVPDSALVDVEFYKEYHDGTLEGDDFSFVIEDEEGTIIAETKNDEEGNVLFEDIEFTVCGDYSYYVYEVEGSSDLIVYDDMVAEISVSVTYDEESESLVAEVSYPEDVTFDNYYVEKEVSVDVELTKNYHNGSLEGDDFEFVLTDEDGNSKTATNDEEGLITFTLAFNEEGTYSYSIVETNSGEENVEYDDMTVEIEVEVSRVDGYLTAEVSYPEDTEFDNYYVEDLDVEVVFTKNFHNGSLEGDDFEFVMTDEDDNEISVEENDEDGNITFVLTFDEEGTYVYYVSEVEGDDEDIEYDDMIAEVEIIVSEKDGVLSAEIEYPDDTEFDNYYGVEAASLIITADKILTDNSNFGRELEDEEFTFQVLDEDEEVVATAYNDEDGEIVFDAIEISEEGTYTYTVVEVEGDEEDITYDDTEYAITIIATIEDGYITLELGD